MAGSENNTILKDLKKKYLHNSQVYLDIPIGDVKVPELEECALNRLHLLKIISKATTTSKRYSEEWTQQILENLRVRYPNTFHKLCESNIFLGDPSEEEVLARQMDHISHFILRAVYSSNGNLYYWFINQETDWLFLRLQLQTIKERELFLKHNCLNYDHATNEEKESICSDLSEYPENEIIYKIHYREALNLIKDRRVNVHNGYAYVPSSLLVYCIIYKFKSFLGNVLLYTKHKMSSLNKQYRIIIEQLSNILKCENLVVDSSNKNPDQQNDDIKVKLSNLNRYAKKNFPLCMQHLYETLKENHHLKYGSRYQLGNFLKAIGLTLEESLEFWKTEFVHKITEIAFERNYAYFFKHMYGKVGSMREYRPETCQNIIFENINIEEIHGCPFKTWDSLYLIRKLQQRGISPAGIDMIEHEICNNQYQKACAKHFELIHGKTKESEINSPHEYLQESVMIAKNDQNEEMSSDDDTF